MRSTASLHSALSKLSNAKEEKVADEEQMSGPMLPSLLQDFFRARPWLAGSTTLRKKSPSSSTIEIVLDTKNAEGIQISHACSGPTLATLMNSLVGVRTCLMAAPQEQLFTLLTFLSEIYTYCDRSTEAFVGMGLLITAAEEKNLVYDTLTETQKKSVKLQLLKEINEAKDIPDVKAIFDKYQNAQFFEHRSCPKMDGFRKWLSGSHSYTKTKIFFIQALQEKAYALLIGCSVTNLPKLATDNADFLDFLFSTKKEGSANNELLKRGVPTTWKVKYEELATYVVANKNRDMPVPRQFDVVNHFRRLDSAECVETFPVPLAPTLR